MPHIHSIREMYLSLCKPWFCLAFCLGCFFVSACASQPAEKNRRPGTAALSSKQQTVVVIPVFSLVKDFRPMSDGIKDELMKQLEEKSFDCYVISKKMFKVLNRKALEESGAIYNPKVGEFVPTRKDVYIKSLISQLASVGEFNLLLVPEIVMRDARISGGEVWWDNQSMSLPISGKSRTSYKVPQQGRGLSLQLAAYTSSGGEQMMSYGAIAVPFYLDISEPQPELKMRKKVLHMTDFSHAVGQAIQPLLTP